MRSEKIMSISSGCSRCETLPESLPARGVLYVAPPIVHTVRDLLGYFDSVGLQYSEVYDGIFAAQYTEEKLKRLCNDFLCNVSHLELRDTKCLILGTDEELTIRHLTKMQPLHSILARVRGEWLLEIIDDNRIVPHFHPIVRAENPSDVFAYECLARGTATDGSIISPGLMFDVAEKADLLFNLDRSCRLAAINGCMEHGISSSIFVNFIPSTIYNPRFCLQTTLKAINKAGISPERVVFEVVESEEVHDADHLLNILKYYREHGFRVALDDLGAGFSSLNLLTRLKPDFIKLDMELVRDVDSNRYKSVITENLLTMASQLGVRTIAEGVETVGEWRWLVEHGADYVQGFLFAKPAAPPQPVTVPSW